MFWVMALSAVAAPAGQLEGTYVQQRFLELAKAGRALAWDDNLWIEALRLDGNGQATVRRPWTAKDETCPTTVDGSELVIRCERDVQTWTLTPGGLRNEHVTLERSENTVQQWYAVAHRAQNLALLPHVAGTWTRNGEGLTLNPAQMGDLDRIRLTPCEHESEMTVCARLDEMYALIDDQLVPVETVPGCGCEGGPTHLYVQRTEPRAHWVRDLPCDRGVCALWYRGNRWVGDGIAIIESDETALLAGSVRVEAGPGVERMEVTWRAHTRAAVVDGGGWANGLGDLGAATDWVPLSGPPYTIPKAVSPAEVPWISKNDQLLALRAGMAGRADEVAKAHAATRLLQCETLAMAPCTQGVGALEIRATAFDAAGARLDEMSFLVQGGFGQR